MEGHAASAAYIVTRDASSGLSSHPVLDENGRLSSAGAATSLKLARTQDLPSFPSQGGVNLASASAAASLAESNRKPFEHWKPGEIPAANKAAIQAKDYEMDPLWRPELSRAGSKAAVLAHQTTISPEPIYKAPETEHGISAAGHAHDNKTSPPAITNRDVPVSDHRKALLAATGAMAGSRRRADSAPTKPQSYNSNWALQAATSSHRGQTPPSEFTTGDPGFEAARVQNIAKNNVSRQMYSSTPPVAVEVAEKNRQDMLRASAVAMARKMYAIQQSQIEEARSVKRADNVAGARAARNRASSDASASVSSDSPRRYENLEEAARKLAQERLAKLHDEHAEYRQYYGATTTPPKSKLSLSLRNRRRASSLNDDDDSDSDAEQSRRIKSQMSIFQSKLAEVDSKKRQADRDALLDAAHRNVTQRLNAMDEKIFRDTGKSSPQQRELWERQARERAQRDSDERMINVGKVHIGGGKYLDQSEVEAIAKARLQPTLDDITEKAEKQRARDEETRLDQERQKAEAERDKARQAEIKQEAKEAQQKEKLEEKARRAEEKRVQKEEAVAVKEKKEVEAAAQKEKARQEKEDKRRSKDGKPGRFGAILAKTGAGAIGASIGASVGAIQTAAGEARPGTAGTDRSETVEHEAGATEHASPAQGDEAQEKPKSPEPSSPEIETKREPVSPTPASPGEVTSPKGDSKVKSWFKSRFRSSSKTQADVDESPSTIENATTATATKTEADEDNARSDSMRDVAMAGRKTTETEDMYGDGTDLAPVSPVKETTQPTTRDRSPSISSLSSSGEGKPIAEQPQPTSSTPDPPTRMSTEQAPSENLESDGEQRGRKGFRQRLLSKVKRDKNKDKPIQEEPQAESKPALENTATDEDFEEARDTFAEEKLAPPPKLPNVSAGSPRGSRERSKFTENL